MKSDFPKDLLLVNGRVFGGEKWAQPTWSDSVLIKNGIIAAVGNGLKRDKSSQKSLTINLEGDLVLPGLCDAHLHLSVAGRSLGLINLEGCGISEIRDKLLPFLKKSKLSNGWIQAFNWEPSFCSLTSTDIEDWLPGRDVIIYQKDLHGCCCSFNALEKIGISLDTPDPTNGIIGRNRDGVPNGLLYESAMIKASNLVSKPGKDGLRRNILNAQEFLLQLGLTCVSENLSTDTEDIYVELDTDNQLKLFVDVWKKYEDWDQESPPPKRLKNLQINTLKLFADGSFSSRTAALQQPYSDLHSESGNLIFTNESLKDRILKAEDYGWRVAIHAIGDAAIRQVCEVMSQLKFNSALPHRIEHTQLLPDDFIEKFSETRLIASIQPVHLLDDQAWLPARIGLQRCANVCVWNSLYEKGVTLALGSDWPVASPDPMLGLHAAVNRCSFNGEMNSAFNAQEALQPHLAIRAASYGWAKAANLSSEKGSISPGLDADLTVVTDYDEALVDWSSAKIKKTICKGVIVYENE